MTVGSVCVKIHIGFDVAYECTEPTPTILMLSVHPSRIHDLLFPDHLYIRPHVPTARYIDMFGNICTRLAAPVAPDRGPAAGRQAAARRIDLSDGQPLLRDRPAHGHRLVAIRQDPRRL